VRATSFLSPERGMGAITMRKKKKKKKLFTAGRKGPVVYPRIGELRSHLKKNSVGGKKAVSSCRKKKKEGTRMHSGTTFFGRGEVVA